MPGTVIVAGVPGVGKTTILRELEQVARKKKVSIRIVNFGSVMNQLFKRRGKGIHRDHMRRQDISLQSMIQQQAAQEISKTRTRSTLVVDTHMFVRTKDGIWPGTPRRVLEGLRPDMIVLIEADPKEVAKRRSADTTRERETGNVEDVKTDLEWSRYMAGANAVLAGVPIQIVHNRSGRPREAAEDLLRIIGNLG